MTPRDLGALQPTERVRPPSVKTYRGLRAIAVLLVLCLPLWIVASIADFWVLTSSLLSPGTSSHQCSCVSSTKPVILTLPPSTQDASNGSYTRSARHADTRPRCGRAYSRTPSMHNKRTRERLRRTAAVSLANVELYRSSRVATRPRLPGLIRYSTRGRSRLRSNSKIWSCRHCLQ